MDLYAYAQIENLQHYLIENHISIPRLRGLRWMGEEATYLTHEDYQNALAEAINWEMRHWRQGFDWCNDMNRLKYWRPRRHYWKKCMANRRRAVYKDFNAFNRFICHPDVLCIHARIGGNNWKPYGGEEIAKQPWFICKADDWFDNTYCNIYVRLK